MSHQKLVSRSFHDNSAGKWEQSDDHALLSCVSRVFLFLREGESCPSICLSVFVDFYAHLYRLFPMQWPQTVLCEMVCIVKPFEAPTVGVVVGPPPLQPPPPPPGI